MSDDTVALACTNCDTEEWFPPATAAAILVDGGWLCDDCRALASAYQKAFSVKEGGLRARLQALEDE